MENELNESRKNTWRIILKILYFCGIFAIMLWLWMLGIFVISLGSYTPGTSIGFWTLSILSIIVFCFSRLFLKNKKIWKWSGFFILFFLLILALLPVYRWYTVDRFKQLNDRINWFMYDPWRADSKVMVVDAAPEFKITKDLPKIDGAYALYPVYSGVVRAIYLRKEFEKNSREYLSTNGSDVTFQKLIDGDVDLIFSAPPSKKQVADAKKKLLTYEITPFAKEAFVFFVNSKNPVNNLTSEQIRQIYSGKITDWSQIDPRFSGKIKPFQRNQGSGSQTMLEKIMGNTPIMPPLKEDRRGGMGGIINDVAGYRNYQEALGFSFRYFSTEMFRNGDIKLIAVDGIPPTLENIRNGSYPFIVDCCIITVKKRSENIRKIVDFMFSPAGQNLVEKTGYVPIPLEMQIMKKMNKLRRRNNNEETSAFDLYDSRFGEPVRP